MSNEKQQEQIKIVKKDVKNPIDCLFDENNTDAIVLFNEKGEEIAFDQIALIPKKRQNLCNFATY